LVSGADVMIVENAHEKVKVDINMIVIIFLVILFIFYSLIW